MNAITKPCPDCGRPLVERTNRATGTPFLGCPRWPECKHTEPLPEALRREIEVMRFDTHPHATFIQLYRHLVKRFGRELGEAMPCERTVRRYIQRTFTAAQDVYERQGPKTFRNTQQEPILRDLSSIGCGEVLVGDHREFDLEVINPARGGELERDRKSVV